MKVLYNKDKNRITGIALFILLMLLLFIRIITRNP